jgi:triacylglycerol lipase
LEDVSHLDLIGWVNTARYKWAELTGKSLKFKPASFYLEVASTLAEEVEGLKHDDDSQPDGHREVLFSGNGGEEDAAQGGEENKPGRKKGKTVVQSSSPPPGTVGGSVD